LTLAEQEKVLMPFRDTDVPDARIGDNVDLCDTDVSRSHDFCIRVHRRVRHPFLSSPFLVSYHIPCLIRFQDDLQPGGRPVSGTKGTPQAPIPLSRFEVASRATSEPYPASQTSRPSRGPYTGIDEQLRSQPYGSSLDSDVERRMENRFSWA